MQASKSFRAYQNIQSPTDHPSALKFKPAHIRSPSTVRPSLQNLQQPHLALSTIKSNQPIIAIREAKTVDTGSNEKGVSSFSHLIEKIRNTSISNVGFQQQPIKKIKL